MLKVVKSTVIAHPVGQVWAVLRDFVGHDNWHPAIAQSQADRGLPTDQVGVVRNFSLTDGSRLREQLLELSDIDATLRYFILDTPVPLFNYVATMRLVPVTDSDHTFWEWSCTFSTISGREQEMTELVGTGIYEAGFAAVAQQLATN